MKLLLSAALFAAACTARAPEADAPRIAVGGDSPLVGMFERVAGETGVPAELLATVSFVETRFAFANAMPGEHSAGAMGLLGLPEPLLREGAKLAGIADDAARTEPLASLRAGAALLRTPGAHSADDYTDALRRLGGDGFTHAVEDALVRGIDGRDETGHTITVAAHPRMPTPGFGTVEQAAGYPGAVWVPAASTNYQSSNRGVGDIDHIVIHDTEGSFSSAVNWFQDTSAKVSAHYVVRSSDGYIVQMVSEQNIAWHDACFNTTTVGIEHEGYAAKPAQWFTETMYAESAKLTAYLCDKYNIKKEHGPILGHGEAPDCSDHTDPGPGWNWAHYIDLVQTGGAPHFAAESLVVDAPATMTSGEVATVTVTVSNTGNAAWDVDATRLGTQDPQDRDSAFFVDGDWIAPNRATSVDAKTDAGGTGTFTFQIRAPEVAETTVYDEAFELVQEDVTWFGPTFHLVVQVMPDDTAKDPGGCNATGSPGIACVMLAFGAALRRRRRR